MILSGLIWILMVNNLRWNWTHFWLCRSSRLTSTSRNLTALPLPYRTVLENLQQGKHYAAESVQSTRGLPNPKRVAVPVCCQE